MQSPNTITMLAAQERVQDQLRSPSRRSGRRIRTPQPTAGGGFPKWLAVALLAAAATLGGLVAAPSASAHDVVLSVDVKSVSDRVSQGTVAGPISGSLRTEVRGRRPLARQGARLTTIWKVRAGERSFTARLQGSVNHRTRRAVLDGRIASGFMAGSEVKLRGRVSNRRTGRVVGSLTLSPHAGGAAARAAAELCDHPCVVVSVVRYGDGTVRSGGDASDGRIDCGTRCGESFATFADTIVLTASGGSFASWKDCPMPAGDRCTIPVDGKSHCVHAFFTADQNVPPSAGSCPVAAPAPPALPVDRIAPQTRIASGPAALTQSRTALFRLGSSEAGARFLCKLDGGAWIRCGSPKRYRALRAGRHVFRVVSVDAAGNRDATPAVRRWRIAR